MHQILNCTEEEHFCEEIGGCNPNTQKCGYYCQDDLFFCEAANQCQPYEEACDRECTLSKYDKNQNRQLLDNY